jgi:Transmembrane domain of unknown function (DUF3566)
LPSNKRNPSPEPRRDNPRVSSRRARAGQSTEPWRMDPEVGSASGGHLSPGVSGGSSLFDPVREPGPSERPSADEDPLLESDLSGAAETMPQVDEPFTAPPPAPTGRRRTAVRRRPAIRRVRRTLRHVDPLSVLKLSLFYYGVFLVLWLAFVAMVYWVVASMGVFDALEQFGQGMVLWDEVNITLFFVERWALAIGLFFVVAASLINVFLAFLYNVGADLVGGIEMTFVERDI